MATTKKGSSKESQAARYKADKRWESNRKLRLERTVREQPNNEQAKQALKGMVYRRKTPGEHGWTATEIRTAKLFKMFAGHFDRAFFSADPKVSQAWLQVPSPVATTYTPMVGPKNFFALDVRNNLRVK